ncbi:MAG: T9SS type A sorting domain-containing protein [Candidatus Aegiribacteria sp.]|nr:T9SS type A sorting domain-containing protein [Candidatus Aegiribacteria sp.]
MDFNSDGIFDIVVGDRNGYVNYFRGTATSVLTTEPDIKANGTTIDVGNSSAPVIVDWNEDGLLDLILGQESTSPGSVRLYLNSGTPENHAFTTYTWIQSSSSNISWSRCTPQVVDINLDGKKDLICGENNGKLAFYENVGTNASPVFSGYEYLESNGSDIDIYYGSRLWVNDWDEDGLLDLLVSDYNGWVYLYPGIPTGIEDEAGTGFNSTCELSISGSPTNGYFSMNILLDADSDVKFRIYSADGRIVSESGTAQLTAGEHEFGFDISGEPSGIYYVQIDTGSIIMSGSVIRIP